MDTGALCEPIALDPASSLRVEHVLRPTDSAAPAPFPHFHEAAELIWFDRAEGEVITEAGALPIRDGTLLFLPPLATHDFRLRAGTTSWVLVHLDLAPGAHGAGGLDVPLSYCPQGAARARLAMAFDWLVALAALPDRSADLLALAGLILKEAPRPSADDDRNVAGLALHRLRPALDLVAAAGDRPVGIADAAARCHLSVSYFSRAFSHQFGIGFSDYARQYRLRAAARSLATGGLRISEIAYRHGFLNASHFSAAFQKRYGVSPTEFRKRHRSGLGSGSATAIS